MSEAIKMPIHGVAVDAGSGLEAAIRKARGKDTQPDDWLTFKRAVLTVLGPHATTVLVDATCGPDLLSHYPTGCERMMAFEADVYRISDEDRITVLPDNLSISDYPDFGVRLLKFFMYFDPDDPDDLNARKQDLVAGIGRLCVANDVRFLMEPLLFSRTSEQGTLAYARRKPELVRRATEAFAKPRFSIDVLKVEIPVDLNFVDGFGESILSRQETLEAFRNAAAAAGDTPLVYLSAGVSFDRFEASLELAGEAGVTFAGFMCGRAIWSDAVEVFGREGETGLRDWLSDVGIDRLKKLIAAL
ncbi:MAG: tagatose 1,6-diphosphate aldolase [Pseudomonadota bacterium]